MYSKQILMLNLIKNVAEIFSGHTFREKIETVKGGDCAAIQLKDIDKSYSSILNTAHLVKGAGIMPRQFLKRGDILFVAKGANNFAISFTGNYKAVASSVFFVIRPEKKILPEFLCWYMNQEKAQGYLHTGKEGSMITNINKLTLENMEVELPSIKKQQAIVEMHNLWLQEKALQNKIIHKKEQLLTTFFNTILNGKD